jgi:uncharacterized protein involved in exopolysaccharide biosynthesis
MAVLLNISKLEKDGAPPQFNYRRHFEEMGSDNLRTLWGRKGLIAAIVIVAFLVVSAVLIVVGPKYTSEATILVSFNSEQPAAGNPQGPGAAAPPPQIPPTAVVDAVTIVDSSARIIRSRATASAVVERLGLDTDPEFAREPLVLRLVSEIRRLLGLYTPLPSPHDLAVDSLMRRVTVGDEAHSYLLTISVSAKDPKQAATLANTVALEYLRGQMIQQSLREQIEAEGELARIAEVYGARHPSYLFVESNLEDLRARLSQLHTHSDNEEPGYGLIGQSFVPAEMNSTPDLPNVILILGLTVGGALAAGAWIALLMGPPGRNAPSRVAALRNSDVESYGEKAGG